MNFLPRVVTQRVVLPVGALLAFPHVASAHTGQLLAPHDLWRAWSFEPAVIAILAVSCAVYACGVRMFLARASREHAAVRTRALYFALGMLTLVIALVSPLDALADSLFSAHMVQHLLLTVVAAPFLVMSAPMLSWLWALPPAQRTQVAQWLQNARWLNVRWQTLTSPLVAWTVHVGLLWLWHLPRFYDAAVLNPPTHALEHLCFMVSALLFWWAALHRARHRVGIQILFFFTAGLQCTLLGAFIAMSRHPWYFVHFGTTQPWGLTPLGDQQLAGLIMWIPAGMVYLIALAPGIIGVLRHPAKRMSYRTSGTP